jgi:hypothetical protein
MERDKIIALIVEDIKHNSLINGLHTIGLTDNDNYLLKLDILIAEFMGHSTISDSWLKTYQSTMLDITHSISAKEAHSQAIILFDTLSEL